MLLVDKDRDFFTGRRRKRVRFVTTRRATMKWSYSFHAEDKKDARAKIQAESANCPITDILHRAVDALPADKPITVSTFGEFSDAEDPHTEEDKPEVPAVGRINISVHFA